jgi:hypothetical protein
MGRFRRFGIIAACAVTAVLLGAAVLSVRADDAPDPIVWRDHVVETTTTTGIR